MKKIKIHRSKKVAVIAIAILVMILSMIHLSDYKQSMKYLFVELYGGMQKLLSKNEVNNFEVIKDQRGGLHFTGFLREPAETKELAMRLLEMKETAEDSGAQFYYLVPPSKYIRGYTEFPYGIPYDYENETADSLISDAKEQGIQTIDLRGKLDKVEEEALFYKTDHHWTTRAAFYAANEVVKHMGLHSPKEALYEDLTNYEVIRYEKSFLGSLGRKTGRLYAGLDDFELIYPKFQTEFLLTSSNHPFDVRSGPFDLALLDKEMLAKQNIYEKDSYATYLTGVAGCITIENKISTDSPSMLIIGDSFSLPLASFLSLRCAKVTILDPRYYEGSIKEYVQNEYVDYVITGFSTDNLTTEFFAF